MHQIWFEVTLVLQGLNLLYFVIYNVKFCPPSLFGHISGLAKFFGAVFLPATEKCGHPCPRPRYFPRQPQTYDHTFILCLYLTPFQHPRNEKLKTWGGYNHTYSLALWQAKFYLRWQPPYRDKICVYTKRHPRANDNPPKNQPTTNKSG